MIRECTHHIGILWVSLFLPSSQSLKHKRMILKSVKDRVRTKFNVSVAELDHQDKWQLATLGAAMIGCDHRHVEENLQSILSFLEKAPGIEISDYQITFL